MSANRYGTPISITDNVIPVRRQAPSLRIVILACSFACIGVAGCDKPGGIASDGERLRLKQTSHAPRVLPPQASHERKGMSTTTSPTASPLTTSSLTASSLTKASDLIESGDFADARHLVRDHLIRQPDDPQAILLLARISAKQGHLVPAVEMLDEFSDAHALSSEQTQLGAVRLLQQHDATDRAHHRLARIIERFPESVEGHRRLALLLAATGRQQEAAGHFDFVCANGLATRDDLLEMLGVPHDSKTDLSKTRRFTRARSALDSGDTSAALILARECLSDEQSSAPERAFAGRVASIAQRQNLGDAKVIVSAWKAQANNRQKAFADYWFACGELTLTADAADDVRSHERAARHFCEALLREPNDPESIRRLSDCMSKLGRSKISRTFQKRLELHDESKRLAQRIASARELEAADIVRLAETLDALDRNLEAVGWRLLLQKSQRVRRRDRERLASTLAYYAHRKPRDMIHREVLCGLDPSEFPLVFPWGDGENAAALRGTRPKDSAGTEAPAIPRFSNISQSVGLDFQYRNAAEMKPRDLRLYEQMGAGVVVLDFDNDGSPDVYFPQAASEYPNFAGTCPNQLFRGGRDTQFTDVTEAAQVDDRGYGLCATSGDINEDGFADLIVGNLGANAVFLNNGDGSFTRDTTLGAERLPEFALQWTASLATGDLNGDGLTDVFEVRYVDDPSIFDGLREPKPENPNEPSRLVVFRGPDSYRPAEDVIFFSKGDRSFRATRMSQLSDAVSASYGLGIVVTDVDNQDGIDAFIANDMQANHLWIGDGAASNEERTAGGTKMQEQAQLRGCALSAFGARGASMGIAAGDFDRNGRIDFHVTNFLDEPVHLYRQDSSGLFTDAATRSGLYQDSHSVLGFGTQAIDFDNSGTLDLAVLNGHVDDFEFQGGQWKMLPQLFRGLEAGQFELIKPRSHEDSQISSASFWQTPSVGRGLATLDVDRDGRQDLIACHLDQPAALLMNETRAGHWLQLELVGTDSSRDAVGARIEVRTRSGNFTATVTSGDGYACKNEALVCFGLGSAGAVREIHVHWPSGNVQTWGAVDVDSRFLLIEGRSSVIRRSVSRDE